MTSFNLIFRVETSSKLLQYFVILPSDFTLVCRIALFQPQDTVSHCNLTRNCRQGIPGPQHAYSITSKKFTTATIRTTSEGQRSIIESARDLRIHFRCVKHKTVCVCVEVVCAYASLCTAAAAKLARLQARPPLNNVQRSVSFSN